ncbi:hypothetical protein ANO11243_045560 [Dothideomycetidae sp. 11243]|nr:hypothetical protein ANO11243_045560 [fungal sp. No.11243]
MASGYALPHVHGASQARGHAPYLSLDLSGTSSPDHISPFHDDRQELSSGNEIHHSNGHAKTTSLRLPMKGRVRGESDLGRQPTIGECSTRAQSRLWVEVLTGALLALQYVLLSASLRSADGGHVDISKSEEEVYPHRDSIWIHTALVTAAILLTVGTLGCFITSEEEQTNKRRLSSVVRGNAEGGSASSRLKFMLKTAVSTALPIHASICLDKSMVGLFLIAAIVSMAGLGASGQARPTIWHKITNSIGFWLSAALTMVADLVGLTSSSHWHDLVMGYFCLLTSTLLLSPSLLDMPPPKSKALEPARSSRFGHRPLVISTRPASVSTALSGVFLGLVTLVIAVVSRSNLGIERWRLPFISCGILASCGLIFLADIESLRSRRKAGLLSGLFVTLFALEASRGDTSRISLLANCASAVALVIGAAFDSSCLNFGFMLVQGFYGWVSGSLGLLSDTVHMFFDCLALIIGLAASVASKWPTSPEKPYGWSKLNTLAGFGNGIFLM